MVEQKNNDWNDTNDAIEVNENLEEESWEEENWTGLAEIRVPHAVRSYLNKMNIFTKEEVLENWDRGERLNTELSAEYRQILLECLENEPTDLEEDDELILEIEENAEGVPASEEEDDLESLLEETRDTLGLANQRIDMLVAELRSQRDNLQAVSSKVEERIRALESFQSDLETDLGELLDTLKAKLT